MSAARPRKELDISTYEGRFAARIKELREKAKLSVEEAAEALGVTADAIYRWEAGQNFPRIMLFPQIAKLYRLKKTRDLLPLD